MTLQPHVSIGESDKIIVLSRLNFDISVVKIVFLFQTLYSSEIMHSKIKCTYYDNKKVNSA